MNEVQEGPNDEILMELAYKRAWFNVKYKPIWAEIVNEDREIETKDGKISVRSGTIIKPDHGRFYSVCDNDFLSNYTPTNVSSRNLKKYVSSVTAKLWAARLQHNCALEINGKYQAAQQGSYLVVDEEDYDLKIFSSQEFNQVFSRAANNDTQANFLMLYGGVAS